eukprot:11733840-Karenia_brevis.AAC.1
MFRSSVYSAMWGLALIRGLVKPGKAASRVDSLRVIRLLCSLASGFSRILDNRARQRTSAGPHQFGFKP